MMKTFAWQRFGGYECSSKGDSRFSAFYARLEDGRTIEQIYQCDVKGYDPGGVNWRLGKGKPPLRTVDLWPEYLGLWRSWAKVHDSELADLSNKAELFGRILSDGFATSEINQAHALCVILNEKYADLLRPLA